MKKFWNWKSRKIRDQASGEEVSERVLFLNGTIAEESWFDDDVTPALFRDELNAGTGNITVWINSPGGDCVAAAQIYNMLMDYKGDVTVKIDGIAASAASVIAMAGTKVLMSPVSMMMIHNPATIAFGDTAEMQKAINMLTEVKESIMNAYEIKTGIDICKRNGKNKLIWFGDKDKTLNYSPKSGEMILTVHRWFANKSCPGNWMYARMGDLAEKVTKALQGSADSGGGSAAKGTQASVLKDLSESDAIKKVGALFTADQKKSGILASVSLAQFILESGYGKSELAQNANNIFGMKCSLSGNTWSGSSWDGKSKYTKKTQEQNPDGSMATITADFRKYPCIEDSIADHSAYLLGAKNGSKLRYAGLKGCKDYKKAVQIIKDGGYATSLTYVEKLISIIERWNLTQYDTKDSGGEVIRWYRVRKSWADAKSQKGAYKILDNAKKCADQNPGYKVFDADGKVVYEPKAAEPAVKVPFLVKVSISDLNIRKGPGTDYDRVQFIPIGVYTILEVRSGKGSSAGWGRLKSGIGWISLDFVKRL